jgi:transposase
LAADLRAPAKQRHTAAKIFRRLQQEHGYAGGYDRVRRYVQAHRRHQQETFIPLRHDPGQRLECDFGHIYVDFPEGRRQVPVLLTTWAYSDCPFAQALATERTEAILCGLVEAFGFYGYVAREVWWDNATTLVPEILQGRVRRLNERYQALASHYAFEPLFCLVRRPQEKPRVENRVKFLQRNWATPVPQVKDLAELNAHLRACCLRERERVQQGQTATIGQRFAQDCDKAMSLPAHAFDPCIVQPAKVDKYQTVRFDHNRYSVPRTFAFQTVTVKGYVAHIAVVAKGQVVARHPRSYDQHQDILDPLHYLEVLQRKPAALEHAPVYRHWQLPEVFGQLRQDLERQHGPRGGVRQYLRVLQLLAEHPVARVQHAIVSSQTAHGFDVEAIVQRSRQLGARGAAPADLDLSQCHTYVTTVTIPLPDLRRFDQLLSQGEPSDVRYPDPIVADQPQAPAAADHACGVCQAIPGGSSSQRELRAVPAAPDGTGTGGAVGQRAQESHQASLVPGAQGLRQLRLLESAEFAQGENPGAGPLRVDCRAL